MITLLLVDDQKLIRQGLKALLELEADLQVVGEAENGQIAIECVAKLQPNVA
jgi:YesN/AraC family two-component response regulator